MDRDVASGRFWRQNGEPQRLRAEERHAAALSMLVARQALRGTLPAGFIHDPALEMLLNLYIARPGSVAIADVTSATTVSQIVAVHWIEALKAEGLVAAADEQVSLTRAGLTAMDDMIDAVVASQRDLLGRGDH